MIAPTGDGTIAPMGDGTIAPMGDPGPRARAGRPRLTPPRGDGRPPREQILDAAAQLFAARGYAATSTRDIAELVGVRQASLYYHVAGKAQLLLELLEDSVRPTLEGLDDLLAHPDPATALYALARRDVGTLLTAPHNLAVLYPTPEVAGEEFAPLHEARDRLRDAYGRLAARVDPDADADFAGALCLQLVELAIELRRRGEATDDTADRIATACLRTVRVPDEVVAAIRAQAAR